MTDDAVRAMLMRLSERSGAERVSPHDFRHTPSTNYSTNGAVESGEHRRNSTLLGGAHATFFGHRTATSGVGESSDPYRW
jgi:integrase